MNQRVEVKDDGRSDGPFSLYVVDSHSGRWYTGLCTVTLSSAQRLAASINKQMGWKEA